MLKRPIQLVCLLVVAQAVGCAMLRIFSASTAAHPAEIRRETIEMVHCGMNQTEIESLLGIPPGDYRTNRHITFDSPSTFDFPSYDTRDIFSCLPVKTWWLTDQFAIEVDFDSNGKAVRINWRPGYCPSWLDRLREKMEDLRDSFGS